MLQLNQDVEEAELTVHFVQGNQVEKKSFFLSCLVTLFTSSNAISVPNKCMKIYWHYILLTNAIKNSLQLMMFMKQLICLIHPQHSLKQKEKDLQQPLQLILNWTSNGHFRRKSFLLLRKQIVGTLGQSSHTTRS